MNADLTKLTTSLPFLTIFASIGLFYNQFKNLLVKIFRFFVKRRIVSIDFSETFYMELKKESFIFPVDNYELRYNSLFYKKEKCFVPCLFKCYRTEIFLYKYFIPVILKGLEGKEFSISYFKYSFPFERYIEKTVKLYQNKIISSSVNDEEVLNYGRFRVETISGSSLKNMSKWQNSHDEQGGQLTKSSSNEAPSSTGDFIDGMFKIQECLNRKMTRRFYGVDNEIEQYSVCADISKEKNKYQFTKQGKYILDQVQKWLKSKKWYEERNIAWRRAFCLFGPSGTGKSTLISETAKHFGIPLFAFNLNGMDDNEFSKKLSNLEIGPGIILFEDIDAIFNLRENLTKTHNFGGLNFEHFINQLSGVSQIQNKIIFITTNHLEKLDDALIRAGRVDEIIKLESLNQEEKLQMARIFFDDNEELINKTIKEGINDSTAEYENRLVQIALNLLWK